MQIQVNTDSSAQGARVAAAGVQAAIESEVRRFTRQITRIEVHLSDENRGKGGTNDKRCALEARLRGLQPVAVTHQAATFDQAVSGAAHKLKRTLESTLGRLRDR